MEEGELKVDMVEVYRRAKKETKQNSESLSVDMVEVYKKAKTD